MKKKIVLLIILLILAGAAWYIFSVISGTKELDEPSPLDTVLPPSHEVDDALDTMDEETKAQFEKKVEEMKDKVMVAADEMPQTPSIVAQGEFQRRAHRVEGRALLIEHGGKKTLRFENFKTINGPNLHIYLSSSLGISDAIDLGEIRGTKGNINYPVDGAIDTDKYNKVLVWCEPFRVLFSYTELK